MPDRADSPEIIEFAYNGRSVKAQPGQSVAAALHDTGLRVLSRSMKYRRPRGVFCAGGYCPNCLVRVDGESFKRACVTPARAGMVVESQTSELAGRDPLRVIDRIGFMFPLGFQYRYFKRQGRLYDMWEANLRRVAGHAKMPVVRTPAQAPEQRSVDLCVVGAGPAGVGAASAALGNGLTVALIAAWWGVTSPTLVGRRARGAPALIQSAAAELASRPDVLIAPARAVGWFDGLTVAECDGRLVEVRSPRSVLATGAYERALVFEGNDLPGVMLASAAVKLAYRDGVRPGERAVVLTTNDDGYRAALDLASSGVEVVAVLDERPSPPRELTVAARDRGLAVLAGARATRALGSRSVHGIALTRGDGQKRRIRCDLVAMSGGWQPADELRFQATSRGQRWVEGQRAQPAQLTELNGEVSEILQGVGAAVGTRTPSAAFTEGRIVALHAARAKGLDVTSDLESAIAALAAERAS